MTDEALIRDAFHRQARACRNLGSPFTARLCDLFAENLDAATTVGNKILSWPGEPVADALALRLCGAMHALVLTEVDAELTAIYPPHETDDETLRRTISAALERHTTFVTDFLALPPQTNETGRSAMLLPGFLAIARETGLPLAIAEIGASAGLNLFFDRFRYDYAERHWGDPASPARLAPELRGGKTPPLDGTLEIVSRAGCDISPVDIRDPRQRLRLRSYIWADQTARLERLDAAISIAEIEGVALEKADAMDFVRRQLAARKPGSAFVLFHSIMWQYMPQASKDGVLTALHEAAAGATGDAPFAHLRMEPGDELGYAALDLTLWPGGKTHHLARCDFHGRWIEWIS